MAGRTAGVGRTVVAGMVVVVGRTVEAGIPSAAILGTVAGIRWVVQPAVESLATLWAAHPRKKDLVMAGMAH